MRPVGERLPAEQFIDDFLLTFLPRSPAGHKLDGPRSWASSAASTALSSPPDSITRLAV